MPSAVLHISLAMLAIAATGALATGGGMTGGWSKMKQSDISQPNFQACLQAAVAAYNAKYSTENGVQASLHGVRDAQQQVVAGMKYHFTAILATCHSCKAKRCEFTVWQRVWMPNPIEVLDMECE